MMRTFIYVDGFNLYNRSLKKTPYKWLDLLALSKMLLDPKEHDIKTIKYYTASVSGLDDPQRPIRQQTYIRALKKHIPSFRVHYGTFQTHIETRKIACPVFKDLLKYRWVKVHNTKEKGTDVNLAVQLVNDAWRGIYDCAVILSNDSDLAGAIKIAREKRKLIGWFIPHNCDPSTDLNDLVNFRKQIRPSVLAACQLPNPIPSSNIRKPDSW